MRNVEQAREQRKMNAEKVEVQKRVDQVQLSYTTLNTLDPLWCPPTGLPLVLPTC